MKLKLSCQVVLLLLGICFLGTADLRSQEPKEPPGGPPEPGTLIPPFVRDKVKLTQTQERQVGALEQDVKARVKKILTDVQMGLFNEAMRQPPPQGGAPGGPGGQQGGGAPGGMPPGGQGKTLPKGQPANLPQGG